jgi:hypothetical protein
MFSSENHGQTEKQAKKNRKGGEMCEEIALAKRKEANKWQHVKKKNQKYQRRSDVTGKTFVSGGMKQPKR